MCCVQCVIETAGVSRGWRFVAVCRSVLHCVAKGCSVVQCVAESCIVSQSVAVCFGVLQFVAVYCTQRVVETEGVSGFYGGVLQCGTVCCGVLQGGTAWYSVLRCVAVVRVYL